VPENATVEFDGGIAGSTPPTSSRFLRASRTRFRLSRRDTAGIRSR
jgi:hypothetical protein